MSFKEKYTSVTEKNKPENKDKIVISDDFYSVGEVISELVEMIRRKL